MVDRSQAISLHRAGRRPEAAALYDEALLAAPKDPELLYNAALCRLEMGDLEAGRNLMERLLAVRPDDPDAHQGIGKAYAMLGDAGRGEHHLRAALDIDPARSDCALELSNLLVAGSRLTEGAEVLERAMGHTPNDARLHNNLGNLLGRSGREAEALAAWREAADLEPRFAQPRCNTALQLARAGRPGEAAALAREAVKLAPRLAEAHYISGVIEFHRGRHSDAVAAWQEALRLDPGSARTAVRLSRAYQYLCDWDGLDRMMPVLEAEIARAVQGASCEVSPFFTLTLPTDEAERLAVARRWAEKLAADVEPVRSGLNFRFARHDGDRLHIGYISTDWCDSPVAHVACTMFGHHDRKHFEITVFATGPDDGSEFRPTIRKGCDHFVDLFALDSRAAAQKIFASGIDILVDMQGNTGTLPPVICALRPAPIQVLYLAYCGTTGSDWIDYLVADPIVVPEASRRHYSEALVLMPECFMAANDAAAIAGTTPGRADEGLPDTATVFCSFANRYKISRDTFTLWMGILAAVPGSVLWLPGGSEVMTDNLRAAARGAGIDPDRVVFARRTASKAEHMARHRLADLFLDTPVYGAHVSGLDSLWAGVPLLTIQGNGFSSRVGASFLKQLGLEELITSGPDAYAELAIALGNDPERRQALRGRVGQAVASGHLFDTGRWVRNLEKAYRALWKNHLAGAPPGTIEL